MTTINIYNWSGLTVGFSITGPGLPVTERTTPPTGSSPDVWTVGNYGVLRTGFLLGVKVGSDPYVYYEVETGSTPIINLAILSNNQMPAPSAMTCIGLSGGTPTCNNYLYNVDPSGGGGDYEPENTYLVQPGYYSPAVNYTFASTTTVIEVPGNNYSGLVLVNNAFDPSSGTPPTSGSGSGSGGSSGSGGDGGSSGSGDTGSSSGSGDTGSGGGDDPDPPSDPCDTCSCTDCPNCSKCQAAPEKDDSSTWYWWVLGIVVVISLLALLAAGGWYLYRRRGRSEEDGTLTGGGCRCQG